VVAANGAGISRVTYLVTGKRRDSNVYFVQSGGTWVLVDTMWRGRAGLIRSAAETLFGAGIRPRAIVLTHVHPDHAGSAAELARRWDVTVYVHPDELPLPGDEGRAEWAVGPCPFAGPGAQDAAQERMTGHA
jgi:glyoxylase-like metal-dependent hydrolase (beta-lactamase superfamily II)